MTNVYNGYNGETFTDKDAELLRRNSASKGMVVTTRTTQKMIHTKPAPTQPQGGSDGDNV